MDDLANSDEKQYWSGPSGRTWITFETQQDRLLSEALNAVMERADLAPGSGAVDIGCGTGALSLAAAMRVGPAGRVLATDISQPLLDRARERLRTTPQAQPLLADAQVADWSETGFDAAISRFGVMFFADPPRAFANIARALKPGGRMIFATWGPVSKNVYWRNPARIAMDRLGELPKGPPNTPGPMGMADIEWSLAQMREAGLTDVACEELNVCLPILGTPEVAADLAMAIGPAARVVRLYDATPIDAKAIRDEIAREMEAYRDGDQVRIPAVLNIYTARTV